MAGKVRPLEQRFRENAQKPLDRIADAFEKLRTIARKGGHDDQQRAEIDTWLVDQVKLTREAFAGPPVQRRLDLLSDATVPVEEGDFPL